MTAAALDNPLTSTTLCKFGHKRTPGCRCGSCHRRQSREAMVRRRARLRLADPLRRDHDEVSVSGHPPPPAPGHPFPPTAGTAASVWCDVGPVTSGTSTRDGSRVTYFATAADARTFAEKLPCPNPHCHGVHIGLWTVGGAPRVRVVGGARPRPLAAELAECYPRRPAPGYGVAEPQWWPVLPELNPPLGRPVGASRTAERIARQQRRVLSEGAATLL